MNFDERLAAAAAKPRPHRDVTVILDEDTIAERDRLLAQLAAEQQRNAADARLAAPDTTTAIQDALTALEATSADAAVTLRFVRMPGDQWAALTTRFPADPAVELHRYYGYNLDAVIVAAAAHTDPRTGERYGFRLDDDQPVAMEATTWGVLFATLSGSEVAAIRDAIWALNEYEPQQRVEAWVKDSGAAARSDSK